MNASGAVVPYAAATDGLALDDVLSASEFVAGWCRTDLFPHSRPFALRWAGKGRWLSWWPLHEIASWDGGFGGDAAIRGRVVRTPGLAGSPGDMLTGMGTGGWGHFADAPGEIPVATALAYPNDAYGYQGATAVVMVQGAAAGTPQAWVPPRLLQSTVRTIARRQAAQQNQPGTMAYEGAVGPLTMGLTRQLNMYRVPDGLL